MCAIPVSLVLSYSFFFGRTLFALDVIYGKVVQLSVDHGPVLYGTVMWPWLSFMETLSFSWYSIKTRRWEKWKWKQNGKRWNSSRNSETQKKQKGLRHWKEAVSQKNSNSEKLRISPFRGPRQVWHFCFWIMIALAAEIHSFLCILMLSLMLVIPIYLLCVFSQ